ncbi:MAG: hypothetical protein KDB65_08880 [Calditrichaeota bacterium]|nr:hypothetical protein [Calditrichota bacterium]MCB9367527.1 hypothetical protein [Calditrichota bacterium]
MSFSIDPKRFQKFFNVVPDYVALSPGILFRVQGAAEFGGLLSNHVTGLRRVAIFPMQVDGTTPLAVIRFRQSDDNSNTSPLNQALSVNRVLHNGLPTLTDEGPESRITAKFKEWQIPTYVELTGVSGQEEVNLWLLFKSPRPAAEVWLTLSSLLAGLGLSSFATIHPNPTLIASIPHRDEAILLPYYSGLPEIFFERSVGSLHTERTCFLDLSHNTAVPIHEFPSLAQRVTNAALENLAAAVSPHNDQARRTILYRDNGNGHSSDDSFEEGIASKRYLPPAPVIVKVELPRGYADRPSLYGDDESGQGSSNVKSANEHMLLPAELRVKLETWKILTVGHQMEAVKSHFSNDFHVLPREIQRLWLKTIVNQISVIAEQASTWAAEGLASMDLGKRDIVDILLRAKILDFSDEQRGRLFVTWLSSNGGVFQRAGDGAELEWRGDKFVVGENQKFRSLFWELTGRGDSQLSFDTAIDAIHNESIAISEANVGAPVPKAASKKSARKSAKSDSAENRA